MPPLRLYYYICRMPYSFFRTVRCRIDALSPEAFDDDADARSHSHAALRAAASHYHLCHFRHMKLLPSLLVYFHRQLIIFPRFRP